MSVIELTPKTQTESATEVQSPDPATPEVSAPVIEVEPSTLALHGTAREVQKLEGKLGKLKRTEGFYADYGAATVALAKGEPLGTLSPATRRQRKMAVKLAKKSEKIAELRKVEANMKNVFGENHSKKAMNVGEKDKVRTFLKRHKVRKEAKQAFRARKTDVFEYRKQKASAKGNPKNVVWKGLKPQDKVIRKIEKKKNRLLKSTDHVITSEIQRSRINETQRKIDRLHGNTGPNVEIPFQWLYDRERAEHTPAIVKVPLVAPQASEPNTPDKFEITNDDNVLENTPEAYESESKLEDTSGVTDEFDDERALETPTDVSSRNEKVTPINVWNESLLQIANVRTNADDTMTMSVESVTKYLVEAGLDPKSAESEAISVYEELIDEGIVDEESHLVLLKAEEILKHLF